MNKSEEDYKIKCEQYREAYNYQKGKAERYREILTTFLQDMVEVYAEILPKWLSQ